MSAAARVMGQSGIAADAISRVVVRVRRQFRQLPRDVVEQAVQNHYDRVDGRPVRDFVPIPVERAAQRDLDTGHPTFG